MKYELLIGDESFSSWSLRGWLMFTKFGVEADVRRLGLLSGRLADDLSDYAPARFVPLLRTSDGVTVGDTLAMAETLTERHPEIAFWPRDARARALARWMVAEMHSGFGALRDACPMNLRRKWMGFKPSAAVAADIARIEALWSLARARFGRDDRPWLFGRYSLADVFYTPVAARIAGYGLAVAGPAEDYVAAHLADPAFAEWRARGQALTYDPEPYDQGLPDAPWPGP
ncbi:MAG: glutathione S-transferase [Pseudomonadota bacterium]